MEANFSCVPVTALHASRAGDRVLLLAGKGSSLCVYDCETKQVLLRRCVLESHVIHGICTRSAPLHPEGEIDVLVLLWAGSAAAIFSLKFNNRGAREYIRDTVLMMTEPLVIDLPDWALFGNLLEPDRLNAVQAYVVTAHNEVHEITVNKDQVKNGKTMSCDKLVSGPGCVLCSACARSTPSGLLVAAGTVFGEVVVWSADKNDNSGVWTSRILNVLLGHKGSVFGMCISEDLNIAGEHRRLLATCSDDRTIRLWAMQNQIQIPAKANADTSKPIPLSDVTRFGESDTNAQSLLAMAWGHLSRIWTVNFLPVELSPHESTVSLISNGEDASSHIWEVTLDGPKDDKESIPIQIREIGSQTNHSGKNIWSHDFHSFGGRNVHYTGGADGSIVATTLKIATDTMANLRDFRAHMPFANIFTQNEIDHHNNGIEFGKQVTLLKQYAIAEDGSILATTTNSNLLYGRLGEERQGVVWKAIHRAQSKSPIMLCSNRDKGSILFGAAGGNLCTIEKGSHRIMSSSIGIDAQTTFMCVASRPDGQASDDQLTSVVIPLPHKFCATLLTVAIAKNLELKHREQFNLPPSFVPTSACHDAQRGLLFLGSRSGSVAIFDILNKEGSTAAVFEDIHGTDSVTSIILLRNEVESSDQDARQDLFVLTTGRDGRYAVHKLTRQSKRSQVSELQTVHRSSPPIGPNIEGAYIAHSAVDQSKELVLYGFKSKDFMVWNETQQTEVLLVDCGGAHRNWAYSPSRENASGNAMYGGTFVWTKAGACNVHRRSAENCHIIQVGGHGREIKALAISPIRPSVDAALIATGAEDTTIRLFLIKTSNSNSINQAENKKMTCVRILNRHTTGIHHLEFSPCGRYLFSSGGCEELFVWQIWGEVPIIGVGVVLECMLPKTDVDADARITSFTVRRDEAAISGRSDVDDLKFNIAAAYSNGKVKILEYYCGQGSRKGKFRLQEEIIEGSFCLTQLHWNTENEILLTAGTNGFINAHFLQQGSLLWKQKVHKNSIQASLLAEIPAFSSAWLVVTGGDDNALALTVFCPAGVTSDKSISVFRTLRIPNAHAAAVTGLTLLSHSTTTKGKSTMVFASVSNDQRVKVWRIIICTDDAKSRFEGDVDMQFIQIEKIAECWSSVADAATIKLLSPTNRHANFGTNLPGNAGESGHELLIAGVGVKVIEIHFV